MVASEIFINDLLYLVHAKKLCCGRGRLCEISRSGEDVIEAIEWFIVWILALIFIDDLVGILIYIEDTHME